ncbi:NADH dehydrogenase [ubiquinone] complex I, assembly factor 7 [Liparis tanakae]|uniref:NADH dehydrogenase [ubiquinone] complex I, assembly factor 7 n=1 Tax=Liparis tanakae TaxID=230148 RepID=A0A4Z2GJI3_9TELE|nr:NADH dehydrogenase [ubiquinone] complex I, assembly factor 7 [Liparis tanakae]
MFLLTTRGRLFWLKQGMLRGGATRRPIVLLRNCTDASTREQLLRSYDLLTGRSEMGERFHFFGLLHPSRLAPPPRMAPPPKPEGAGLKLEKKSEAAPLPVAGFTELGLA